MEAQIHSAATQSVFRGCSFGMLAVVTCMLGLSFDPPACFRFGGFSMLLMSAILVLKAWRAEQEPYKRTEVWIMLEPHERPPEAVAPALIAAARQAALYRFARLSAYCAAALLAAALLAAFVQR